MARTSKPEKKPIEPYEHKDKQRLNNPPVGLVTPETDKEASGKTYSYDFPDQISCGSKWDASFCDKFPSGIWIPEVARDW